MTTNVAGQAHRSPRSKKILATEWGYGQIQGVPTAGRCGYLVKTSRSCAPTRVPFKHLWGLQMVNAKRSESGKCLPLSPRRYSRERSPVTLEITDLSAVFHMPWPRGTPLAFTKRLVELRRSGTLRPRADSRG